MKFTIGALTEKPLDAHPQAWESQNWETTPPGAITENPLDAHPQFKADDRSPAMVKAEDRSLKMFQADDRSRNILRAEEAYSLEKKLPDPPRGP